MDSVVVGSEYIRCWYVDRCVLDVGFWDRGVFNSRYVVEDVEVVSIIVV